MGNRDPVLTELDAEIRRLEVAAEQVNADLRKVREMRAWWAERHPQVVRLGQAVEVEQALPIEVAKSTPTLRELILEVLRDTPVPLPVPAIRDHALARGWDTPSTNKGTMVRNNLRQLIEEQVVVRVGDDGKYWLRDRLKSAPSVAALTTEVEASPAQPGRTG
jgi:hypothetical protein